MIVQQKSKRLANKIVLVDGISRSGKTLVSNLISSFRHVEIQRMHASFDFIGISHFLGNINNDTAITFLRHLADEFLYSGYLSRDINFRWKDFSSVFKSPKRNVYFYRLFQQEGVSTLERISKEGHYYQNLSHDQIRSFPLFHEAWGDGFKMIEIIRDPVDLVKSWLDRGFGVRFAEDPMMLTPNVRFGISEVPFYAIGWEQEYLESSPKERVIKMLYRLQLEHRRHYRSFSEMQKQKIKVIRFEDLVTNTRHEVAELANFLDTSETSLTRKSFKRQNCPRSLLPHARKGKYEGIVQDLDEKYIKLLDEMIEHYSEAW